MKTAFVQRSPSGTGPALFSAYACFRRDAPCARERGAWLQPHQRLPGSKCVRRAGHRLDCKTATAGVGKRVAAKEHQVGVALVHPERDFSSVVQISELHTSEALLVPLEIMNAWSSLVEPIRLGV